MASKKNNKKNNDGDTIGFGDPSERSAIPLHGPLADDDEVDEPKKELTEEGEVDEDDEDETDDDEDIESHGYHAVDFDSDEGESF